MNEGRGSSPRADNMAVTIPTCFEANLALGDGSAGAPLSDVLQFTCSEVANLYSSSSDRFTFCFQERGVAYGEKEASEMKAEASCSLPKASPDFSLQFVNQPVEVWGINFAGTVRVCHKSGQQRLIYLPGTRTYDPAGITGDPHASERIGPSCSRTQIGVSACQLVAAVRGAHSEDLSLIQERTRPLILRYHGRECLFDWMKQQVEEAIYHNRDVSPYPEFLKQQIKQGKLQLGAGREHTKAYLESYESGKPCPPVQYYRKVAVKDKPDQLLSGKQLEAFNHIIS